MGVVMYGEWLKAGSCVYLILVPSVGGPSTVFVCPAEYDNCYVRASLHHDSCLLCLSSPDVLWVGQLLFLGTTINELYCFHAVLWKS